MGNISPEQGLVSGEDVDREDLELEMSNYTHTLFTCWTEVEKTLRNIFHLKEPCSLGINLLGNIKSAEKHLFNPPRGHEASDKDQEKY